MNITFIGGGNMARALIGGLVARGSASNAFAVVDPSPDARATISARFGVATFAAIEPPAVAHAEIVVLAPESPACTRFRGSMSRGERVPRRCWKPSAARCGASAKATWTR